MKDYIKTIVVKILTWEAKLLLKRHSPKIVAITGSVGKTTTKDAIYRVLKTTYIVRKSEKSFNSELGVPLTILGLPNAWNSPVGWLHNILFGFIHALFSRSYPDYLVLETGVDAPGDMERLVAWLTPDITVLTRLPDVPVHVEHFSSPEAVVNEKMKLVHALPSTGILLYNADDTIATRECSHLPVTQRTFARYKQADYMLSNDQVKFYDDVLDGYSVTLRTNEEEHYINIKGSLGMHITYACGAAVAVGDSCEVSLSKAVESLQEMQVPAGRMRIIPGIKGTTIIDDTYNSSPVAVENALQTFNEISTANRKIAVLGDMLELGSFSVDEHKRVGKIAAQFADLLLTVGVRSRATASGALENQMDESAILQYEDAKKAGLELQNLIQNGDIILIKGSQGVRMEKIVEEIMREPEKATELLVRQESAWKNR